MFKKGNTFIVNFGFVIILLFTLFYVLYIGANLIIPFIIALLFSFAIIGLSNFYKKLRIPSFLSFTFSLLTYIGVFWLIGKLFGTNIDELVKGLPLYQARILEIYSSVFDFFGIDAPASFTEVLNEINLQYVFTLVIGGFTSIFSKTGIILFYVLFILLEYRYFKNKLYLMIVNNAQRVHIIETLEKIKADVKSYFVIKTIVSFLTAVFSYIIMIAFKLDFAIFWSMLVFILNFIPNIGSIIAVLFPSLLSLVQPGFTPYDSVFMISGLTGIQVLMGNIIEPRFMGNRLNLSPLVIIISLGFWGTLWGVVGMLLSVPIMVIINIILGKIPVTRPIAILLSEKGDLQIDDSDEVANNRKKIIKSFKEKFGKIKTKSKK
ncbi:MAG: AI-2E family transporter [Candidatus Gracilibacteria bacterium]|nr:AI-2E family transporter [Candidatus Gracilibacteria bacterium]